MKHVKPLHESSWIESVGFDGTTLEILCKNGRLLEYTQSEPEVPLNREVFDAFLTAESPGGFYNRHIKKLFRPGRVLFHGRDGV